MRCTAHNRQGGQCGRNSIPGGNVCNMHGGKAPQVQIAARRRLLEAVDPAAAELIRIALEGKQENVRVSAIKELFERAGFGDPKRIEVTQIPDAETVEAWIEALEADLAGNT